MGTIIILVNGLDMPYHVVDRAIAIAKEKKSRLLAIFLEGKRERREGYVFPSDLDAAEKGITEAETLVEDKEIISHNSDVIARMAEFDGIQLESKIIENPKLEELIQIFEGADLIVADRDFDSELLLDAHKITLKRIVENSQAPVELVEKT
jgi:hypothetical protein